ncbi:uncharacterized protein LOC126354810 [Schistocerca gregaria]|uniref:uncharacterized protein LOC126354810 n=1 Tax=Schistocerca gregaria TaxID=7010 RepID=UPI00211E0F87|nr:uncharacterized protein LOC126354810 [Schistocerca gregaria]
MRACQFETNIYNARNQTKWNQNRYGQNDYRKRHSNNMTRAPEIDKRPFDKQFWQQVSEKAMSTDNSRHISNEDSEVSGEIMNNLFREEESDVRGDVGGCSYVNNSYDTFGINALMYSDEIAVNRDLSDVKISVGENVNQVLNNKVVELEEVECDVDVRSCAEVAKVREVESNGEMLNDAEEEAVDDSDDMEYRSEIRVFVVIKNDADVVMKEEGNSVRENNHSVQEDQAAVTWVNTSPVIEGIDRDDINIANEEKVIINLGNQGQEFICRLWDSLNEANKHNMFWIQLLSICEKENYHDII